MTTLHDPMPRNARTVHARDIKLIRPGDDVSRAALRLLAYLMGARVQPGYVSLNGRRYAALLAVTPSGVALAAVLLDEADAIGSLPACLP